MYTLLKNKNMSKEHQLDQPTSPLPIVNEGEDVYAYLPDRGSKIQRGVVTGSNGPFASVQVRRQGERSVDYLSVHRSNLFTPGQVACEALDLMPDYPDGGEVHVDTAVNAVINHPFFADGLTRNLELKAMERYTTPARTPEELGVRSVGELLGNAESRSGNRWKLSDMIQGINDGRYGAGSYNYLDLARPTQDIEVMPEEEASNIRGQIDQVNRQALDVIYDEFGADFEEASVFELTLNEINKIKRCIVIPSKNGDFSFVQTSYVPQDKHGESTQQTIDNVMIITGQPDFSREKGYFHVA
jgi:hypothetical protein